MNSHEIRLLKNLKINQKNLEQSCKFFSLVQEKVYEIFSFYINYKGIYAEITDIEINDNVVVSYKISDISGSDDFDTFEFPKIFLTYNKEQIKNISWI